VVVADETHTNSEEESEVDKFICNTHTKPKAIFFFLFFCFVGIIGGWIQKLCVWYATSNFSVGCSSSWDWESEGGES